MRVYKVGAYMIGNLIIWVFASVSTLARLELVQSCSRSRSP